MIINNAFCSNIEKRVSVWVGRTAPPGLLLVMPLPPNRFSGGTLSYITQHVYAASPRNGNEKENQHVNPCVNLTTVAGKSHLRLKSGFTLLELQVTANCSPSLRMTLPFWDSVTAGGSSGTAWKDQKQHYCNWWLIVITKLFCIRI